MKTPARRCSVPLVFGLLIALPVTFAQNIASDLGASGQNRERLTLLPGPSLLSPGRGIALPEVIGAGTIAPVVGSERSSSFRFVPGRIHARPAHKTLSLVPVQQSGVQPMSFDSAMPPRNPLARPTPPAPAVGELRFDAKLPPAPAPALKRE